MRAGTFPPPEPSMCPDCSHKPYRSKKKKDIILSAVSSDDKTLIVHFQRRILDKQEHVEEEKETEENSSWVSDVKTNGAYLTHTVELFHRTA